MNKVKADVIWNHYENALEDGGDEAAWLVLKRRMRKASNWDLVTLFFWAAYPYLTLRNPRMIPLAFPWLRNAFQALIHGWSLENGR